MTESEIWSALLPLPSIYFGSKYLKTLKDNVNNIKVSNANKNVIYELFLLIFCIPCPCHCGIYYSYHINIWLSIEDEMTAAHQINLQE